MKKFLLALLLLPLNAVAAFQDWGYMPFIQYTGQYPSDFIKHGHNFDLLETLWRKPQSLSELKKSGFDFSDVDTTLLLRQGMIYRNNNLYYSAIPFIDSLAMNSLRQKASEMAKKIIDGTKPERESFMAVLDSTGYHRSAFALVHSLVFDDTIWDNINVSQENSTIWSTDSMTWKGVFYFYRPEGNNQYGTNGIKLDNNHLFKFAWGENSNGYLCTVFINTKILSAIRAVLAGTELTEEMIQDCRKYGAMDETNRLTIPILDGTDPISLAADKWSKAAAEVFENNFDNREIAHLIGFSDIPNEAACKVILYHEVLTELDRYLDETGLLPIPEVLKSEIPADKTLTGRVAYISAR